MPDPADTIAAAVGHVEPKRERVDAPVVGVIGAGQLARMLCEAASALGIHTVVLAEHADDSACGVAGTVVVGHPGDRAAVGLLSEQCEVITLDHEQVDLELLRDLVKAGVQVAPPLATIEMAVDKRCMRSRLAEAGFPVPEFAIVGPGSIDETMDEIGQFAARHGWPLVLKAARGGYDGQGVWPVADIVEAREVCQSARSRGIPLLVEELVPIDAELAVLTARRPGGQVVVWPTVETAQVGGVCREVLVPGRLGSGRSDKLSDEAAALGIAVARLASSVGVLAVELFWSHGRLLVNEVAARPHNSGHWTIEGSATSQFENHVRAVLDLPLGQTTLAAPAVATVNVFGAPAEIGSDRHPPTDPRAGPPAGTDPAAWLEHALEVPGAHIHLYGKQARPGRKLGHVTVCGDDPEQVRQQAWRAARALGTPVPVGLAVPQGTTPADPAYPADPADPADPAEISEIGDYPDITRVAGR